MNVPYVIDNAFAIGRPARLRKRRSVRHAIIMVGLIKGLVFVK